MRYSIFAVLTIISVLSVSGQSYAGTAVDLYDQGLREYTNGNTLKAYELFIKACDDGFEQACVYKRNINKDNNIDVSDDIFSKYNNINLNEAIKLYKDKKYIVSFPVFNQYCKNHDPMACLYLSRSYASGRGVGQNTNKALEILDQYYDTNDVFKFDKAQILEYRVGDIDATNKAINIYNSLINSNIDWVAEDSRKALTRVPTYIFLGEILPIMSKYNKNKIKYDFLVKKINSVDLSDISPQLRSIFTQWRDLFLKIAKYNDDSLLDTIFTIGKSAVKGFIGDYTFIIDAAESAHSAYKISEDSDRLKYFQAKLNEQLGKEDISFQFVNNLLE